MDTAIEIKDITKRYGNKTVVGEFSLKIQRGSVFGLIGPNGAGKTTLIKILIGLLSASSGKAHVLGLDVNKHRDAIQRRVGYVPESPTVYRWMTVEQVLDFCRTFRETWSDELCKDLFDIFELDRNQKVKQLSKGMLTKLSLVLALAHEPELLILDEPTTGLDVVTREEFLGPVLRMVCERECTVLFSSHSIEDIERLADHVGLLTNGQLQLSSSVFSLLSNAKRIRAVLHDGCLPETSPTGTIWQQVDRREWLMTVLDFTDETVSRLKETNRVDHVELADVNLSELFKDFVKGQKVRS